MTCLPPAGCSEKLAEAQELERTGWEVAPFFFASAGTGFLRLERSPEAAARLGRHFEIEMTLANGTTASLGPDGAIVFRAPPAGEKAEREEAGSGSESQAGRQEGQKDGAPQTAGQEHGAAPAEPLLTGSGKPAFGAAAAADSELAAPAGGGCEAAAEVPAPPGSECEPQGRHWQQLEGEEFSEEEEGSSWEEDYYLTHTWTVHPRYLLEDAESLAEVQERLRCGGRPPASSVLRASWHCGGGCSRGMRGVIRGQACMPVPP